jgi:hypothetical protein
MSEISEEDRIIFDLNEALIIFLLHIVVNMGIIDNLYLSI